MTIQRNHFQTLASDSSLMTEDYSAKSLSEDGHEPESERSNLRVLAEYTDQDLAKLTDDQLMAQLRSGGNDALAVLFDRYNRLVFSVALRIVRDNGEAEDVVQIVFLDIFRCAGQFNPAKGSAKVWILQYAYHRALNRQRQLDARKFYSKESIEEINPEVPDANSWYVSYTKNELRLLVKRALTMLGQRERQVIELAAYEGLSMREIADVTGETLGNVRHRYYRGLRKLRSVVESTAPDPKDVASPQVDVL
jgi:RNA polymerase sigma-70 factor, ECF subfamily